MCRESLLVLLDSKVYLNLSNTRKSKTKLCPLIVYTEFFIWIILKTILCLLLDFQGIYIYIRSIVVVHVVRCARYQSFFDNLCYICCILRYLTTSFGRCYPNFAHVFLPYSAILWLVLHTYAHRFSSEAFPNKGDSIFFAGCQYSLTWLAVSVLSSWLSCTEKSARSCTVYGG